MFGDGDAPDSFTRLLAAIDLVVFDFDGVFTDNKVYVFDDGREAVCCSRSDGLGLQRLRDSGVHAVILSTETNQVVSARARKIGLDCIQGLTDKGSALRRLIAERSTDPDHVAFVGNDINDMECLRMVGLPVVVADAYAEVAVLAKFRLSCNGGQGAVREFCDLIVAARTQTARQTE